MNNLKCAQPYHQTAYFICYYYAPQKHFGKEAICQNVLQHNGYWLNAILALLFFLSETCIYICRIYKNYIQYPLFARNAYDPFHVIWETQLCKEMHRRYKEFLPSTIPEVNIGGCKASYSPSPGWL